MKKSLLIIITVFNSLYLNAETFFKIELNNHFVKSNQNDSETIIYDDNGFAPNGIHKDTGTIYNTEGFNREGYDESGFNNIGVDINGNTRYPSECATYNGLNFSGSTLYNMGGADYFVTNYTPYSSSPLLYAYRWNSITVGTTNIANPITLISNGYYYYSNGLVLSWSDPNSPNYKTFAICRRKI